MRRFSGGDVIGWGRPKAEGPKHGTGSLSQTCPGLGMLWECADYRVVGRGWIDKPYRGEAHTLLFRPFVKLARSAGAAAHQASGSNDAPPKGAACSVRDPDRADARHTETKRNLRRAGQLTHGRVVDYCTKRSHGTGLGSQAGSDLTSFGR